MTAVQTALLHRRPWHTCFWVSVRLGGAVERTTSAPPTQIGAGTRGADGRGV